MTRNELLGQLKRGNFNMLKQFPGLSSDETLMLDAYVLNPEIYKHIDQSLLGKESFFYELASINPELVKGTPYAGKKDFMKKLISSAPIAAKFMQKRLYDDPIFVMEIATKTEAGEIIIETMKNDPGIKSELQRLGFDEYRHVDSYDISRQREMISRGEVTPDLANNVEFMGRAIETNPGAFIKLIGDDILNDQDSFGKLYDINPDAFINQAMEDARGWEKTKDTDEELAAKRLAAAKRAEQSRRAQQKRLLSSIGSKWTEDIKKASEDLQLAIESGDPDRIKKAQEKAAKKAKHAQRYEEDMKTPEGRERQAELAERLQSYSKKAREEENKELLRNREIRVAAAEIQILNDSNATIEELNKKLEKDYSTRALYNEIGRKYKTKDVLGYLREHPDELENITSPEKKQRIEKLLKKYEEITSKEDREKETGKMTTSKATANQMKNDIMSKVTEIIENKREDLQAEINSTTDPAKKEELKRKRGELKQLLGLLSGDKYDKGANRFREMFAEETEIHELMNKEAYIRASETAVAIQQGVEVPRDNVGAAKLYIEKEFKKKHQEIAEKVAAERGLEYKGNLITLINNDEGLREEIAKRLDGEDEKEFRGMLEHHKNLEDVMARRKKEERAEKQQEETTDVQDKDNENTRDEEEK